MTESTANWIQVVISGLTFLVFVGLAVITFLYARHTKRMANIMSKEFEFMSKPFVDLRVGLPFRLDDYSGFQIPLEALLLGEFPLTLTKIELEVELGAKDKREILRLSLLADRVLTKNEPSFKNCMGPFAHKSIKDYMEKRMEDTSIKEPELAGLYIYYKNIEGKEELFQRLPVPYRNYYELDKICDKGSDIIGTFGRRIHDKLEEF